VIKWKNEGLRIQIYLQHPKKMISFALKIQKIMKKLKKYFPEFVMNFFAIFLSE